MTNSSITHEGKDLRELLRNVIADGDFGLSLRAGEAIVVHTRQGSKRLETVLPTHEEIAVFLRQLTGSRGMREFRDSGVTRFMVPFENGIRLVGGARLENDGSMHVEIRRMAGRSQRADA